MAFQQTGIPDNVSFLIGGIVLLLGLLGSWVASLLWRARSLRRTLALLRQMEAEDR